MPTLFSETPAQTVPQTTARNATQAPAQSASLASAADSIQSPASAPGQAPAVAAPSQPVAVVPQPPATPEEIGDALMAQQRYQAAIEAYKRVLQRSPDVWNKLGIAYQLMFNLDEASRCYQASLRLDRKNARVMNNLGTIYDSEKEYGNAERMYHRALKSDPKSALIYKNLGTNLLAQHKYKQGWEVYKTALELDPNIFRGSTSPRVQNPASTEERGAMNYYMAKGCVRAGMNDCAIEYLRMALNEGFTNPKKIEADGEFAGLRGVPAFQQLLAEQRQQ
jgi:tetratricopeptide (TPR) repeat protein